MDDGLKIRQGAKHLKRLDAKVEMMFRKWGRCCERVSVWKYRPSGPFISWVSGRQSIGVLGSSSVVGWTMNLNIVEARTKDPYRAGCPFSRACDVPEAF
jgi:hypothetical protein